MWETGRRLEHYGVHPHPQIADRGMPSRVDKRVAPDREGAADKRCQGEGKLWSQYVITNCDRISIRISRIQNLLYSRRLKRESEQTDGETNKQSNRYTHGNNLHPSGSEVLVVKQRYGAVPEVLHVLGLVNAECDPNLEWLVGAVFTDLQIVPLGRLGCRRRRHQDHLQHCNSNVNWTAYFIYHSKYISSHWCDPTAKSTIAWYTELHIKRDQQLAIIATVTMYASIVAIRCYQQ